ncbi:heavy metal-associated isoprenylated plant protein 7-like [Rhododendron vialii]|uniref:heavy metal-associated isoprenylated plant protein 7-like n=1 Tax=Rhododendron vialii TaxID=182163 RepID=UPI00265E4D06|nr:heavy metal-associated isoprenylated plant protein 7-like [Rhododendron vialii]
MGEENKEEEKKGEEKKNEEEGGEKKEQDKKEEDQPQEIVVKVDMHCEACARKVARALKGFQGVEDVTADYKASKVVVKGKTADPIKVCERIQKKSRRKVELISPLPKPPEETKEEIKEPPKEDKKEEPPAVVTVVLKVGIHCEACAQDLQKKIRKIPGVESATADLANDQVIVKGVIDPEKLISEVYKRTKKQASIVKDEEKKEEDKKEGEDKKEDEKKDGEEEGKAGDDDNKMEIKRSEYLAPKYYSEYYYAPQIFSDENPHACSVM